MSRGFVARQKTGTSLTSALNFTSAVVFTNICRDVHKLLPWCYKTFAVVFTNFCRGVKKHLPWCSQTFAVVLKNICRGVHKLLP